MKGFSRLLRKDLRDGLAPLLVLLPLTWLSGTGLVWNAATQHVDTSPFNGLRGLAMGFVPLVGVSLAHNVVARELSGKTQLFLEALPISRLSIFISKALVVVVGTLACTFLLWLSALAAPAPTALRATMLVRLLAFGGFAGAALFLSGFLGRYRLPLAVATVVAAAVVSASKSLNNHRGPLGLIDESFANTAEIPHAALVSALVATSVFLAVALVLASWREGDVAARMAEKMSQRERVFIALAILAFLVVGFEVNGQTQKLPFVLSHAAVEVGDGVEVHVGDGTDSSGADRALAVSVRDALVWAHTTLGLDFRRVIIVSSPDLPEGEVQSGVLSGSDGLLFRVGPTDGQTLERLLSLVAHKAVARAQAGLDREGIHAVLDGFSMLVARRAHLTAPLEVDDDVRAPVLAALPEGPSAEGLKAWWTLEERLGHDRAYAFAFVGLRVLAVEVGEARTTAFLQRVLAANLPRDARVVWRAPTLDAALRETCGITLAQWIGAWAADDAAARARLGDRIAAAAPPTAELSFKPIDARNSTATVRLTSPASPESRFEIQVIVDLVFHRTSVDETAARREERSAEDLTHGVALPFTAFAGTRFAWRVVALGADGLRSPSPWQRVTVPDA